jgi:hypothetical protein
MAITITLVHAGKNRLRYLLSSIEVGTDTGVITTTGAATPDIKTDLGAANGPLMALAKVITQGYGQFASGVQTQAKARALWLSDRSGADPASGTPGVDIVPTALCRITPQSGLAGDATVTTSWLVDANVSGGNPTINITSIGVSDGVVPGTAYLDIFVGDAIGD